MTADRADAGDAPLELDLARFDPVAGLQAVLARLRDAVDEGRA